MPTLALPTLFLALLTLAPFSGSEKWWVRAWEFPRPQIAVLAAAVVIAQLALLDLASPVSWLLIGGSLGCLIFQVWWIIPYTRLYPIEVGPATRATEERIRILCSNVLRDNRDAEALLDLIEEHRPDLVCTLEVDDWWDERLAPLIHDYPHSIRRPQDDFYGMNVYSRLPLEEARVQFLCEPDKPSAHMAVVLPTGRRIRVHCLHPAPPSPSGNEEATERDAELLVVGRAVADAELPVIVCGDLNDVAWSPTTRLFRRVSGLLDPRVGRGMFNTFHADHWFARWSLDHVFHSNDFTLVAMRRLPSIGSDHFPILIELALQPEKRAEQHAPEEEDGDQEEVERKAAAAGATRARVHAPEKPIHSGDELAHVLQPA